MYELKSEPINASELQVGDFFIYKNQICVAVEYHAGIDDNVVWFVHYIIVGQRGRPWGFAVKDVTVSFLPNFAEWLNKCPSVIESV